MRFLKLFHESIIGAVKFKARWGERSQPDITFEELEIIKKVTRCRTSGT